MKTKTLKLLFLSGLIAMLAGSCEKKESFDLKPDFPSLEQLMVIIPDCDNPVEADLIAGQHYVVGKVSAEKDGNLVKVTYRILDPVWSISEIHLAIGDIPVNRNNNPKVGHFAINEKYDQPVKYKTFEVGITWAGPVLPVAAHAVVQKNLALEYFNESLPAGHIDFQVSHPGTEGYFNTTVTYGETSETLTGWCIDTDHTIYSGTPYRAELVSTYELAGMGLVEYPENLGKVNWILNQGFLGQASSCGGEYTFGDIQRAIWALVEDEQSTSGLGTWSQCRVDEILAAANESGDSFEPACEQVIAVALVPYDVLGNPIPNQITITQITIVEKLLECTEEYMEETAWGAGVRFNDNNWATLFYLCN